MEKRPECIPIWYRNKVGHYIRCPRCKSLRHGCSFGTQSFRVATWPTVKNSVEGNRRRAADAASRKKTNEEKAKKAAENSQAGRKRKGKVAKVEGIDDREEELPENVASSSFC